MIAGFFTWNESIVFTRVFKVITRVGMTGCIYLVYRNILNRGAVDSFKLKNEFSIGLYAGYLLLGLVSFCWSTNVGYSSLQWVMDMSSFVFSYYLIKAIFLLDEFYPDNPVRFYNLMGNVAFMLLFIFTVGMIVAPDIFFRLVEGGEDARLGGYIMNPNELGMYCGLGVSCLIFDLYRKPNKWWTIFKILILVIALVMTKSRSSLVGLLLIVFFHIRNSKNIKLEILTYIGVTAVLPIAISKLILRKGGIDDVLSMTGRMPFWKALITEGLPKEPLFGFGFMRIAYGETFKSVHTYEAHMTHNTFMQVIMNLGLIGFAIVIFQMIFTVRGFIKEDNEKRLMLLGILIPVIINSFTEFGIFGETNYGILFYQMLIIYICIKFNPRLTPLERKYILKKRPDFDFKFKTIVDKYS
jgi:O-antigen ligase